MEKCIALGLFFYGVASLLFQWVCRQKQRQNRIELFVVFLQKSLYAMENERMYLIPYLMEYQGGDEVLTATLQEIGARLGQNEYPHGEMVWKEVFVEKKEDWNCDEETFLLLLSAAYGFFSGSRNANLCFLQKSIRELEQQLKKRKEKDAQERKVWLPLGMLGSMMFLILFI